MPIIDGRPRILEQRTNGNASKGKVWVLRHLAHRGTCEGRQVGDKEQHAQVREHAPSPASPQIAWVGHAAQTLSQGGVALLIPHPVDGEANGFP